MPNYLADVTANPNPAGLPGSNVLQQIVNGADAWALAITLVGGPPPTTAKVVGRAPKASGWSVSGS